MEGEAIRQAVVIIHGIGEQKPMDTLRGFVDSVLPDPPSPEQLKFWSKPDRMSESFELRRLSARPLQGRPRTDFYEYYWAFHMRDTRWHHVLNWLLRLLLRSPARVPRRIRHIWIVAWVLILTIGGLLLTEGLPLIGAFTTRNLSWFFGALFSGVGGLLIKYLGDAARYMTPSPENIAQRQQIRADGIRLLRELHNSGKYDRIILVGHSLGSVIAYDILTHLWTEYNKTHARPESFSQDQLKRLHQAIAALEEDPSDEQVDAFQDYQHKLWLEQRRVGNPWLVTDLITLGSPLTSAALLLAHSEAELREQQKELALPTCPPQPDPLDNRSYSFKLVPPYETPSGQKRTLRALHHAAQFACTRWTNFYYPGDFIGGPLAPVFGAGIKDIPLRVNGWKVLNYLPTTHTWYWRKRALKQRSQKDYREQIAVEAIVEAMDLQCNRWLGTVKGAPQAQRAEPAQGEAAKGWAG